MKRALIACGIAAVASGLLFSLWPRIDAGWQWWKFQQILEQSRRLESEGATLTRYREVLGEPRDESSKDGNRCLFFGNDRSEGVIICGSEESGKVSERVTVQR